MSIFQRYVLIHQGSKNAYEMLCVGTRQTPLLMKKKKKKDSMPFVEISRLLQGSNACSVSEGL